MRISNWRTASLVLGFCVIFSTLAFAQKYDVGVSEKEIKIGNITPYSGPVSAFAVFGKTQAAYFEKINAEGGINGRKINFISYDDAYNPAKTVEQARKLVESDEVWIVFSPHGTAQNTAIHKYLNAKKVPQLFVSTGATKWNDPAHFPWTMGFIPNYQGEARIYAQYILKNKPNAKIAVLYQNDDFGKDYLKGLKDGLGEKAQSMIVAAEGYESTQPTVDSQLVKLKASGADLFINIATPKFAAQAIRKVGELGWKPTQFVISISVSLAGVMKPAGMENAQGIISAAVFKDPIDPQWKGDAAIAEMNKFLGKYYAEANQKDPDIVRAYTMAQALEYVLRQCGNDLTRSNVMKQAASIKNLELGGLLPGIKVNTSPTDFAPLSQMRLMRFEGERWHLFGDLLGTELGN